MHRAEDAPGVGVVVSRAVARVGDPYANQYPHAVDAGARAFVEPRPTIEGDMRLLGRANVVTRRDVGTDAWT
jgi:hypothetical protein